jgi:Asp-tRNA(Asn)/Glu-tRNA(Gln) amidotransferase A subunit family amidase
VTACLERIGAVDASIEAWAFLDPEHAIAQARAADARRRSGRVLGPLHGVPVALKDIIDTADMPTEYGSPLYAGHVPALDAAAVAMLRAAGAVIMGKTVTTEFAAGASGKTRNPHDSAHTPGGSSSGSAAAVAAAMVPVALGSQTTGSTIRPASYCGVYGFKSTHGLIPRTGLRALSRTLDHVGVFARTIDDVALTLEQLTGCDRGDPDSRPRARIPYLALSREEPPLTPMLAFVKTPWWDRVDADAKDAFAELVEHLGDRIEELELLSATDEVLEWQRLIMEAEVASNFAREWTQGREGLSPEFRDRIERGRSIGAVEYLGALARIPALNASLTELFEQRYDAIVTPAAAGTAPKGLQFTGDRSFCTLWTLCGMPALSVPLMQGANGLPLGVQLVGPRHGDARLLRTARWLVGALA